MTLNEGLVAKYSITGNANDSSGNGNDGSVVGATLTTDKNGVSNQAYSFDGVNDYIQISNNSSLEPSKLTVNIFAKSNQSSWNTRGILAKRDNTDGTQGYLIHPQPGTQEVTMYLRATDSTWMNLSITPTDCSQWHMYTMTYDSSTLKVYLDGKLVNSQEFNKTIRYNGSDLYIGQDDGLFCNVTIDEPRIYNRVLTDTEIQMLYQGYDTDADCVETLDNAEAIYHFTGNANDSSGNGNNGTVVGATLTTDKNGVSNQAYSFDGVNDYISNICVLNTTYSISMWININDFKGGYGYLFTQRETLSNTDYRFLIQLTSTNQIQVYNQHLGTSNTISTSVVNENTWYHFVLTYDESSNQGNIYIDGTLDSNGNLGDFDPTRFNVNDYRRLGSRIDGDVVFDGKLDEVRIYDRALTQDEITQLYTDYDNVVQCPSGPSGTKNKSLLIGSNF